MRTAGFFCRLSARWTTESGATKSGQLAEKAGSSHCPSFRSKLGLVFGIDALVAHEQLVTFHALDGRRLQGPETDHLVKQPMDIIRISSLALALLENNKSAT